MLTPEYLNKFTDGYLGMCDVLNEQITRDIAKSMQFRFPERSNLWLIYQLKSNS